MVLATIFVSLPFVVREVVPVLRDVGTEQEQAAATLGASPRQIFWRITLPAIRWGVAYGVVLTTARCLGEFGAVSVVSGKVVGRTETLTLHVENQFQRFDLVGAYAASVVLALMAHRHGGPHDRDRPEGGQAVSILVENATKRFGAFAALAGRVARGAGAAR